MLNGDWLERETSLKDLKFKQVIMGKKGQKSKVRLNVLHTLNSTIWISKQVKTKPRSYLNTLFDQFWFGFCC